MPGSLTLWFKPVLQGFVWSHQSKPMLISPHHFALTGWISVRALFLSRSSEYDNQSHNFKNFNICDVTLVFSFDSVLQQSLAVFIHNCIMKSSAKLITVWHMQYILSISILLSCTFVISKSIFKCLSKFNGNPHTYIETAWSSLAEQVLILIFLGIKVANFYQQVLKALGCYVRAFIVYRKFCLLIHEKTPSKWASASYALLH